MNNSQKEEKIQSQNPQTRFSIFRNQLFQSSQTQFTKVPLHFQLAHSPIFVLDHGSPRQLGQEPNKAYFSRTKRSSSKTKIFEKRRSMSLKSGLLTTTESPTRKDTITSQDRIRKGSIFNNSSKTATVREQGDFPLQEKIANQLQTVKVQSEQSEKRKAIAEYTEMQKYARSTLIQQIIYTPEELRRMNDKHKRIKKISDEPLKPCQFFNLMSNVIESKRSKRSINPRIAGKMVTSMIPGSSFCGKQTVEGSQSQQRWIYHI